jgi:NitT/TauT family transport system permease protein
VFASLLEILQTPDIYLDMWQTILRVSWGVIIASFIAVPLGLLAGAKKSFEDLLFPIIELLRPIPNIAWAPLVVVLFPVVEHSIIFITFIGAFFPILLNTISGVRSIERKYFFTAWTLHFSRKDKLMHLVLPASLPMILTGVRIGLGVSWLGVIVAEMLSGKNGIGYYTWLGYQLVDYTQILVGIVLIGTLSALSSGLISLLESRVLIWRKLT